MKNVIEIVSVVGLFICALVQGVMLSDERKANREQAEYIEVLERQEEYLRQKLDESDFSLPVVTLGEVSR